MTAAEQLNRIVQLVAELTRREREARPPATLRELAARFGTTVAQIQSDIRTLTLLGDDPNADWLLSLRVSQEGETVRLSSAGPFRRPIRFTPDELLALKVGLATEDGGERLAQDLAVTHEDVVSAGPAGPPLIERLLASAASHRCVESSASRWRIELRTA